ncbi:hypothetical protein M427DRAFT_32856 [Gonapodya prolifera JEL478]|uniref:EF-hand domain-containing protein n=1 Tax=Gonapodya prolifera (strain JEL478) TaxID=1344416 RepID=A0A139ADQ8_GONPJ|nr:hypothetical protein M427DRAFT_32856 [Gonapodya prolifera JEL478]|eukprot:KXS14900.1 hypothetical protein M427DRAFT_32856 [Gonapodya prolifera JEL478]
MRTLGLRATKLELDALVNEIDSRGTGEIDFDSFVTAMSRKVNINETEDEILNAFAQFADECGPVTTVTKNALVQALVLHGEKEKRMTADDTEDLVTSTIQAHSDTMGDRFDYVRFVKETMNK